MRDSPPSTELAPADARRRRWLLLVAAAVIAGAGVAYELSLMLLGTVTVGATEHANAIVLGTAMFGMGIGATVGGRAAKRPVVAFVTVEATLAVLGAAAAPALYWTWARLDAFWGPLLTMSVLIGVCIGAEMPLLAALNDRLSRQTAAEVVAEYTAADYFGALLGAVAFAFVLRPRLGIVDGTIVVAVLNLAVAVTVIWIMPRHEEESASRRLLAAPLLAAAALVVVAGVADTVIDDGRQALYRDPVVAARDSGRQEIVVTARRFPSGVTDVRLFLDGDLQLSSLDEHRYHESLVHPAMTASTRRVVVFGGGDCLAIREVLRHGAVESVTLVELDPAVTAVVADTPELSALTEGACADPRVHIVEADAFVWARRWDGPGFDAVIVDFPDPDTPALGRLYSVEFAIEVAALLEPGGRLALQCGSPFFAPEAYWTCAETLETAGWQTVPYHVDVPSFGDWGFHLAMRDATPTLTLPPVAGLRFLTRDVLEAAGAFPLDVRRDRFEVQASTVLDPTIVDAARGAWLGYDR